MNVQLISVTPSAESLILKVARVSNPENVESGSPKLIEFLIKNGHWSPFELAHMVVEITTSRAIAQQILRHRSFSFQEFSQRYASPIQTVKYKARRQSDKNRQSSIDDLPGEVIEWFYQAQDEIEGYAFGFYQTALDKGIAKECARFLLPLSTETTLYMSGSIRSWIHYLADAPGGRTHHDVQQEHRLIAMQIQALFIGQFPTIAKGLGWAGDV